MPKVNELWAFVSTEEGPEDEGIVGSTTLLHGIPMFMPLVGADVQRMGSLMDCAQDISNRAGKKVELRRFTSMEVVCVMEPNGDPKKTTILLDELIKEAKND